MAILEKEVWVGLNHMNIDYYEQKGYEIPRIKDKRGKYVVPIGTKINIKVDDLQKSSNVKVTKICDDCEGLISNKQAYNAILFSRNETDGKDRCRHCGNIFAWVREKENIPYEKSLEYFSKYNNKEYLLVEFSEKNIITPNKVFKATNKLYIWNCSKCKSEYSASVNNRINSRNCPYCTGRKVNITNCLWTTQPETASLLLNSEKGYEFTAGTDKKAEFLCGDCGNIELKSIVDVVKFGFTCHKCGDGISYPEKFIFNFLSQLNVYFEREKIFNWSMNKRYDFYIPSLNCIIEAHGRQHYEEGFSSTGGKTLKEEQKNDQLKEMLAKENDIKNYIVINCSTSEISFIKKQLIDSKLSVLCDLKSINWIKCHEYSCSSIIKTVCNLWNDGIKSTIDIGKIVKLDRATINKYLKQSAELGWSNYDPKQEMKKIISNNGRRNTKQVIQLTIDNKYTKTWDSLTEVENTLGIQVSNLSSVCKGKKKTAGGFKWMLKTDYDKLIENK